MNQYQTQLDGEYLQESAASAFISKVYAFMAGALAITAIAAYYASQYEPIQQLVLGNSPVFFLLFAVELGLVIWLSRRIDKMAYSTAALLFTGYSLLNGVTLSSIFMMYSQEALTTTFVATAGTFGVMSLIGFFTKKDLTRFGGIMRMALVGLIIATIVNWIWPGPTLYMITTYVGVLVFVGLTAYDTQKIKRMAAQMDITTELGQKAAILGALTLYLDFINLFLLLLRFFGDRD